MRFTATWPIIDHTRHPEALIFDAMLDLPNIVPAGHTLDRHAWTVTRTHVRLEARALPVTPDACPSGHEYTPENTYRDGNGWRRCRTCRRAAKAKWATKHRPIEPRFPAAPILRLASMHGVLGHRIEDRTVRRAFERAQAAQTVTARAADLLCCKVLGLHPLLVYGDEWLSEAS